MSDWLSIVLFFMLFGIAYLACCIVGTANAVDRIEKMLKEKEKNKENS